MLDHTHADRPTAGQRRRATEIVRRHALGDQDVADLLAMLGLDHDEPAAAKPHHPHGALSAAELFELVASFAGKRTDELVR